MKMVARWLLSVAVLSVAFCASAETALSDVVVNQRWPWSEKVDVDFVLSGDASDVTVSATWDAHAQPYVLGTLADCRPGHCRFTWDPSKSPYAGQTLTGFAVTLASVEAATRFLVIDLVNGGFEYRSAPPAGGWTDEYKSSKMAFRRIPSGTYVLGDTREAFAHLGHYDVNEAAPIHNRRTVTFTSDFYVGVFKYTAAQHACLSGSSSASYLPQNISYNDLRGAAPDVNWPDTGYSVAAGSVVAKLREKAGEGLVVDLCQEEQWEVAARAGTSTLWPNGGTTDDSMDVLTNYLNQIAAWYGNTWSQSQKEVGTKDDNGWGLYDVVGLSGEWALDTADNTGTIPKYGLPSCSVDPTGVSGFQSRILKSASGNWPRTAIYDLLPSRRQMQNPSRDEYSTRFCIHLKPLGSLTFEGL